MTNPPNWPVSVKGVVVDDAERVVLLKNERDEWELPGGRLERFDSSPEAAVEREVAEETGWAVKAGPLLSVWIYQPLPDSGRVVIVTYGCTRLKPEQVPVVSHEHQELGLFTRDQVPALAMPEGYKRDIAAWMVKGW